MRSSTVFGAMENEMGGIFLRSISVARVAVGIRLMNLAYNLKRIEVLIRMRRGNFTRVSASKIRNALSKRTKTPLRAPDDP